MNITYSNEDALKMPWSMNPLVHPAVSGHPFTKIRGIFFTSAIDQSTEVTNKKKCTAFVVFYPLDYCSLKNLIL